MDNIIQVRNLIKTYGDVKAVNDISFDVKKGNLFAFLGLNGAGKSTTINILCSIIGKDFGEVFIDGLNLDTDREQIKERLGIVFQGSVLDKELSVASNLRSRSALYGLTKREADKRIDYVNSVLGLDSILNREYGKLSGGQRRKADIARALIHKPKILFLDEPTTGLDPNTRLAVWGILDRLIKEDGLTIFLTTHYMEEVVRADNVVILDSGKIAAIGTPDELKGKYATDFVRLITPNSDENASLFASGGFEYEYKNNSYYIKVENSKKALEFINHYKQFSDNFEILKGDMDNVFLNVTGKKLNVQSE